MRGTEAGVGRKRNQKQDFQQSGLIDGQAVEGGADFGFAAGFPEDSRAWNVAATPDLAKETGGVKLLYALGLAGGKLRREGFGGKGIGTAAGKR